MSSATEENTDVVQIIVPVFGQQRQVLVSRVDYERILRDPKFYDEIITSVASITTDGDGTSNLPTTSSSRGNEISINEVFPVCEKGSSAESGEQVQKETDRQAPVAQEAGGAWTHESVLLLIDEYTKNHQKFKRNKNLFIAISKEMESRGYKFTPDQIDKKWRNLKTTYKRVKDNKSKTGRGTQKWSHFCAFDELFRHHHSVSPVNIIDSMDENIVNRPPSTIDDLRPQTNAWARSVSVGGNLSGLVIDQQLLEPVVTASQDNMAETPTSRTQSRKRKLDQSPPNWFKKWGDRQEQQTKQFQDRLIALFEAKNKILQDLVNKL